MLPLSLGRSLAQSFWQPNGNNSYELLCCQVQRYVRHSTYNSKGLFAFNERIEAA
jgi:hypothetical protein